MWSFITDSLSAIFDALSYLFREAWRQCGIMATNVWAWFIFLGTLVYGAYEQFQNAIYNFVGLSDYLLNTISVGTIPAAFVTEHFRLVNTFLPVVEGIGMLIILVTIISIGTAYRFIKSWIPTLS